MPRSDQEVRTTPSVLDRLLDDEPDRAQEPTLDWHKQLRELKRAVGRDLEALLNTRQEAGSDVPDIYKEARRSLLTYGLPDFSGLILSSPDDCRLVRQAVERAIKEFEPRLEVKVFMDDPRSVDRALHFRIEGILKVEPTPEPVTFDAVLQPSTQEYDIKGGGE